MNAASVLQETTTPTDPSALPDTRMQGSLRIVAGVGWIAATTLVLILTVVALPTYQSNLQAICVHQPCADYQLPQNSLHALQVLGISVGDYAVLTATFTSLIAIILFIVGCVLAWRKSDDWMALLVAFTLVVVGAGIGVGDAFGGGQAGYGLPATLLNTLGGLTFLLVFLLFPSGRFVPHWAWCLFLTFLLTSISHQFFSSWPFSLAGWSFLLGSLGFAGSILSVPVSQIYRYRRVSTPLQRQQTKWIIFGITLLFIVLLGSLILPALSNSLYATAYDTYIVPAGFALIPLSLTIAILRYHLWDIDLIINRTLVYGALTASVVGLYILVVGYLGALFRTGGSSLISLVGAGLVAVLLQPLRGWLQRGVNRLMYGQRDEPYAVVASLGRRLESTLAPEAVLPAIAETVATALKLPYVAFALRQGEEYAIVASHGAPVADVLTLPLSYQTEPIGKLMVGPRQRGEPITPTDRRLLHDLARQAGLAAHAVRLTADLQRSREHLVIAREEERRRLRRDLHDGLGATLAALHLQAGAIRSLMYQDLPTADAEIRDLQGGIRSAVSDIRRLVYALRPPTLDEFGLVGAIQQYALQYDTTSHGTAGELGGRLRVGVELPEQLPALPAAVEVAAYRVVQEALTNVVRHAQAEACHIRLLFLDDQRVLQIAITDDGVGLPKELHAGVGFLSMRERADEVGGSCAITSMPAHGTQVLLRLPLPQE